MRRGQLFDRSLADLAARGMGKKGKDAAPEVVEDVDGAPESW